MTDPWDGKVTPEQRAAAVKLAERMARAAGKTQPAVMVCACVILMETAYMAAFPNAWIDWKIARGLAEASQGKEAGK